MKKALSVIGQFILFLLVFLAGSLANPFHLKWFVVHPTPTSTRFFVPDGLLLLIVIFVVILLVQGLRKRLIPHAFWTTAAFAAALVLGMLAKFGSATHEIY